VNKPEPGRYRITDPDGVARVVNELVAQLGGGNEKQTAHQTAVSQPTLYRLRHKQLGVLSRGTVTRLESAALRVDREAMGTRVQMGTRSPVSDEELRATPEQYSQGLANMLALAIATPEAFRILERGFDEWCGERVHRLHERRDPCWRILDGRVVQAPYCEAVHSFRNHVTRDLLNRAWRACRGVIEEFDKWMVKQGVTPERRRVSHTRLVEPLAEAHESAFVERSIDELSPTDLRNFLDAGIKRERILLRNRGSDLERAAAVARGELRASFTDEDWPTAKKTDDWRPPAATRLRRTARLAAHREKTVKTLDEDLEQMRRAPRYTEFFKLIEPLRVVWPPADEQAANEPPSAPTKRSRRARGGKQKKPRRSGREKKQGKRRRRASNR
jgi:hypothetical protein